MIQVVTGDSQEEVMIFRDKHTHTQTLHHDIYIITIIITVNFVVFQFNIAVII